jgi:hypothetical protein
MLDIRTELADAVDEAELDWLMPHLQRDAVIVVTPGLELLDVGVAIATDNVAAVQHWISEQLIYKPSPNQISDWSTLHDQRFQSLIVQPYVLVKAPD